MARARNSSTLEAAAEPRRAARRSCRSNRHRRLPWRRSLRRMRRAIDSSLQLVDSCRRVVEDSEQFGARRPIRTSRQLQRAAGWLCDAGARLGRAANSLRDTVNEADGSPEYAADVPAELILATAHWLQSAAEIDTLFDRLNEASSRLLAAAKIGAVTFDLPGLDNHSRPKAAAPRLITGRLLLEIRLPRESGRFRFISIRRQRVRPAAFAEAARRVFRGRAPPHAAICSL
jgi:hypothetical protein